MGDQGQEEQKCVCGKGDERDSVVISDSGKRPRKVSARK